MRPRWPTKATAILYAYAWLTGLLLSQVLAIPAGDILGFVGWATRNGAAVDAAALLLGGLPCFLIGFVFECLTEGDWLEHGLGAFAATTAIDLLITRRFHGVWSLPVDLLACLGGSRLAYVNLWRPNIQRAREMLLSIGGR
jgi:hypothetical protein